MLQLLTVPEVTEDHLMDTDSLEHVLSPSITLPD